MKNIQVALLIFAFLSYHPGFSQNHYQLANVILQGKNINREYELYVIRGNDTVKILKENENLHKIEGVYEKLVVCIEEKYYTINSSLLGENRFINIYVHVNSKNHLPDNKNVKIYQGDKVNVIKSCSRFCDELIIKFSYLYEENGKIRSTIDDSFSNYILNNE